MLYISRFFCISFYFSWVKFNYLFHHGRQGFVLQERHQPCWRIVIYRLRNVVTNFSNSHDYLIYTCRNISTQNSIWYLNNVKKFKLSEMIKAYGHVEESKHRTKYLYRLRFPRVQLRSSWGKIYHIYEPNNFVEKRLRFTSRLGVLL